MLSEEGKEVSVMKTPEPNKKQERKQTPIPTTTPSKPKASVKGGDKAPPITSKKRKTSEVNIDGVSALVDGWVRSIRAARDKLLGTPTPTQVQEAAGQLLTLANLIEQVSQGQ